MTYRKNLLLEIINHILLKTFGLRGGTSAFGKKAGQSNAKVIEALKSVPEIEPFTEEEWKETVKHLADN